MADNPLLATLKQTRLSGRMALCGYFLVGYPTPDDFFRAVRAAGQLDVIEFGIPADSPALEGPVIAKAHDVVTRERGIHAEPALALIGGLSALPQPRFVMTYAAVGRALHGFLKLCVDNHVHGVLAPDADTVEGAFVAEQARALGLASVILLDARAPDESVRHAAQLADVVYLKASSGVTGQDANLAGETRNLLSAALGRLRSLKPDLPVAIGIGVQRPEQVAALAALGTDMVIVGTRIVESIQRGEQAMVAYIDSLKAATYYPPERDA
jgi:tryptophan synthase alpha chain